MAGRLLKVSGLMGGGILALGTGAAGTHLSQPLLEKTFNPEGKNREDALKESYDDAEAKIKRLTQDLSEVNGKNELQQSSIESLSKEKEKLDVQIKDKQKHISQKDEDIKSKDQKIQEQKALNETQKQTIANLGVEISNKENELRTEKENRDKIQKNLDVINQRLELTRENILTEKAIKLSSTLINTRAVEWKAFHSGGISEFEVDHNNIKKTIKMKKNKLPNHEEKALEIRKKGITFQLNSAFETWSKRIKINRYDIDYGFRTDKESEKKNFTTNTVGTIVKFSEYFKEEYFKEAFKVLLAISHLENSFICHNVSDASSDRPYLFCEDSGVTQNFFDKGTPLNWDAFGEKLDADPKFIAWTNRFVTADDFINYWTMKTVEFVRTGTVDFLDFLHPLVLSKNYQ